MTSIKCSGKAHPRAGRYAVENCQASIEVELATPNARFLCRNCSPADTKNTNVHFQNHAFDTELKGRKGKKNKSD